MRKLSREAKKFWSRVIKEYKTKPKLIREYKDHGHTVKVYEPRYARL